MARIILVLTVLALVAGTVALAPADAQDNSEARIAALETQVAGLTVRVTELEQSSGARTGSDGLSHTISGTVTLIDDIPVASELGWSCYGFGEFEDVSEGTQVVVKDEKGTIGGVGELGVGETVNVEEGPDARIGHDCRFPFVISNVPDFAFYSVEVGERGPFTYSRDELEAANWIVELTIGE